MHVFLKPSAGNIERINLNSQDQPGWFASPLNKAFGNLSFGQSLGDVVASLRRGEQNFLMFTVSSKEIVSLPLIRSRNLVTLFQWPISLANQPIKQSARDLVLRSSSSILTYSKISQDELGKRFPRHPVNWIGHYVDTNFFSPSASDRSKETYILVVGDHLRLEGVVHQIAKVLQIKVIRVSRIKSVASFHANCENDYVEVRSDISFLELLELYQNCALVLNPVDDLGWPVGITSFCEALSVGRPIVTSGRHSCSGYVENLSPNSAKTVDCKSPHENWIEAVSEMLAIGAHTREDARDIALDFCSLESCARSWQAAFV